MYSIETPESLPDAPTTRPQLRLGLPSESDAAAIWRLVRDSGRLDPNSPYAYLLLCSDFRQSGVVARAGSEIAGFCLGYPRPPRPDALFVWQIGVAPAHRGRGLAGRLLAEAVRRQPGVRFLEATVTPSNEPSQALFRGFARRHGWPFQEEPAFAPDLFPDGRHEEEIRIRIGPLGRQPFPREQPEERD